MKVVPTVLLLLLVGAFSAFHAAPDAIGVATASGPFVADSVQVRGNATLFEGSSIETSASMSAVRLQAGPRMQLGKASRARVYGDRLVVEKGVGQLERALGYRMEALGLHIVPGSPQTKATVAVEGASRVAVSAQGGTLQVSTPSGTLLARLEPGRTLAFESQATAAAPPFSLSGCLNPAGSRFLLRDTTSGVDFELRGQNLAQYAGRLVEIAASELKGVQPGAGASQVIQVVKVSVVGGACAVPTSTSQNNRSSSGRTKAIVAGVAIAAVAGGVTLGLTGDESEDTISR